MKKKAAHTDSAIIEAILSGGLKRENAVKILFDTHLGFLFKIKRKFFLPEEDLQDAYVDAIIKLSTQISLGKFRGDSKLSTYLYSIFFNKCVDLSRKKQSHTLVLEESILEREKSVENLLHLMEVKDEGMWIRKALDQMGASCKKVLMDWAYWGYSMEEIAQRNELKNAKTAKSLKYKCLKKLRSLLQTKNID
ncbi:MAG: sigma-70 family RNA polymerase sigma factor [Bacteroidota bacterium]